MSDERRYWDSDCFLGWLQAEDDKVESCRQVLNLAESGNIEIVSSALTIAEVLMLRGRPPVPKGKRDQVNDFFKISYIVTVSITRRIAEDAREFVWDNNVKPKDALHVATALHANTDLLNTFDEGLLNKSLQVGSPGLRIERPSVAQPTLPGVVKGD